MGGQAGAVVVNHASHLCCFCLQAELDLNLTLRVFPGTAVSSLNQNGLMPAWECSQQGSEKCNDIEFIMEIVTQCRVAYNKVKAKKSFTLFFHF